MLRCVLAGEERQNCVSYAGQDRGDRYGKCNLNHACVRCDAVTGIQSCDQYREKEKPRRCEVCGVTSAPQVGHFLVGANRPKKEQAMLCTKCHDIYDSIVYGQHRSYGHDRAMDMLHSFVFRVKENRQ